MLSASLKGLQQSQALISLKIPFLLASGTFYSGSWAIHFCTVEGPVTYPHLAGCGLNVPMLLLEYSIPAVKSQSSAESC